jgi:hypothetical protein
MSPPGSPVEPYHRHLEATAAWLVRSIDHGDGGSCNNFSPLRGWSRPYPETTGYLIPTLFELSDRLPDLDGASRAVDLGEWLLSVQDPDGWWSGGLHPPKEQRPSIFNTAQILRGMTALDTRTEDGRWLAAAGRANRWMAAQIGPSGTWEGTDYRASGTPSYYSYAAAPMLSVAMSLGEAGARDAALRVLDAIVARRRQNGTFPQWGFTEGDPAFTHTIAYTLQGLLEAAALTGDWGRYGEPTEDGLRALARLAEGADGRLPGRIDDDWQGSASYVCLTGNAQIAWALLELAGRGDAGLTTAAVALTDYVVGAQRLRGPGGIRGAVGGSSPLWGRYMFMRYPNWAAKYLCDALLRLTKAD